MFKQHIIHGPINIHNIDTTCMYMCVSLCAYEFSNERKKVET